MIRKTVTIARILMNPRIVQAPVRTLRELRRRGTPRLTDVVGERRVAQRRMWRFLRTWLDGEHVTRHRGQWVINSFVPPFPGPAYERLFAHALSGRRLSPISAYLGVTAECPYTCTHCSARNRQSNELDTATWEKVIGALHALECSIIGFTGGEPFVRDDLPQLVRAASEGASTIVFTSGAEVTSEKCDALKAVGLWGICVSIDYPTAQAHDRFRGYDGAFRRACETVTMAREKGFYTMIGAVATPAHVEENILEELYTLARRLRAHELRIVEPMPCGLLQNAEDEAFLTDAHISAIRAFHVTKNRRGRGPKVCAFNHIESPELFGCGGGTQHMYIDSAGNVCPCDFTPMSFGSIVDEALDTVWTRMSTAMHAPRRKCFVQENRDVIRAHNLTGVMPLDRTQSEKVCACVPAGSLPDYFAAVSSTRTSAEPLDSVKS